MKPKKQKKTIERRVKCLELTVNLLIVLCFCLSLLSLVEVALSYQAKQLASSELDKRHQPMQVEYVGLSEEQIIVVQEILSDLKPEYLYKQQHIKFVDDILTDDYGKKNCQDCYGFNVNNGEKIVVKFQEDNKKLIMYILCHELIHTFVDLPKEAEEKIVTDIGYYMSCYKSIEEECRYGRN